MDLTKVIELILSNFYQASDDPEIQAIEQASWLRVLRGVSAMEALAAWEEYQDKGPRSANHRLAKPDAQAIRRNVMKNRQQHFEANKREQERLAPPAPPQQLSEKERYQRRVNAERIIQRAGFNHELAEKLARRPLISDRAELAEADAVSSRPHWTHSARPEEVDALEKARNENPLIQAARADRQRQIEKEREEATQ